MNHKIQELAEQCYERHPILDTYQFDKHKFAELLIKECVDIACNYDKPKLSGPGLAIACKIESHFDIYIEEDGRFVK